jgi:hypothetical protein
LAEGHLLIIPEKHFRAVADLPALQLQELETLYRFVESTLREVYGACICFEHGIRGERAGGCGIDHAHIHAVPVAGEGVLNALTQEFRGFRIGSLSDIRTSFSCNSSYVFFEDFVSGRFVFPVEDLPSQFVRKLVAKSIGTPVWDWRQCGHEPGLIATQQRLSPVFSPAAIALRG